jgi:hypothetical protein
MSITYDRKFVVATLTAQGDLARVLLSSCGPMEPVLRPDAADMDSEEETLTEGAPVLLGALILSCLRGSSYLVHLLLILQPFSSALCTGS